MVPCLSIPEAAGWLHPQHSSIMGFLQPRFLEGCSSQQLTTGSLSHSTVSFCTKKNVISTLLQPRRVFLLPSVCPRGLNCMGCAPGPNHMRLCRQGSQGQAQQGSPDTSSDGLQPFCSHRVTHAPGAFCTPGNISSAPGMNFTQTTPKPNKTSTSASDAGPGTRVVHFGHYPELIAWTS